MFCSHRSILKSWNRGILSSKGEYSIWESARRGLSVLGNSSLLQKNGADSETRIIPRGVMSKISANFKVSKNTVKNVWMTLVILVVFLRNHAVEIGEGSLMNRILILKNKVKPSTNLKSLQDKLSENIGKDVHKSAISRALHKNLQEGE